MAYPFQTIQLRRGTAAEWVAANPVLAAGEIGVELVAGTFKIGDGATAWNSLGYATDVELLYYFKLDQTVPQTVSGGMPTFADGLYIGPPGFLQVDGNVYIGYLVPADQVQVEHYCDGTSAYILRSALHPDYAQFAWGMNTDLGYVFFQSNAHGTGTTLPITFWVNALRAWDISTGGHLLSGGTGLTAQHIETIGHLYCGQLGVGVVDPDALLHLEHVTGAVQRFTRKDTAVSAADIIGRIEFETQDTGSAGVGAFAQAEAEGSAGEVGISVGTGTGGAAVERLHLDHHGNLEVSTGDVELSTIGTGVILKSPDGTRWRVTVADDGAVLVTAV